MLSTITLFSHGSFQMRQVLTLLHTPLSLDGLLRSWLIRWAFIFYSYHSWLQTFTSGENGLLSGRSHAQHGSRHVRASQQGYEIWQVQRFLLSLRWSLPPTLVTLASFSFLLANPSLRSFYIWTDMTSMSFVRSFLSHPLTQALLASGDCVWFSAQGDMTPSFHSPEVKCLRWHRQREQSHNLLSNKNVKLTVWHSNLRGCLIYILSHKAVRRFPDVWHCNKVLIFCLTRPHIKIIALTLERE